MNPRKINHARLRPTLEGAARACALLLAALCAPVTAAAQTREFVELVSINSAGIGPGNNTSTAPRSSDGGRFVVFESVASDLVTNDANGASDIFVRDRQTGVTLLVSVNAAGTASGDGESLRPSVTPDGRYVLFLSRARNLVSAAVTGGTHLYLRDLVAQTTTFVDVDSTGAINPNLSTFEGVITPDGRFAAYTGQNSIYWRDLQTNTVKFLDSGPCGSSNCFSAVPSITPDGRYVAFVSNRALVPNDTNGPTGVDVYRYDTQTDTTTLVSVNKDGIAPMTSTRSSSFPAMSDDGQVIAFQSMAFDIIPADDPSGSFTNRSIYARNLTTGTTTLVSQRQVRQGTLPSIPDASQPRISSDGRYVFYLRVENFVTGLASSGFRDRIFRRDLQTGDLLELPFVATGVCDEGFDCRSIVESFVTSRDGRYVAYRQFERWRVNSEPSSTAIVVRDMVGGGTEIVNGFPTNPGESTAIDVQLILTPGNVTNDGKLAFSSGVSHAPHDTNGLEDVYLLTPPPENRLTFNRSSYFAFESNPLVTFGGARVRRAGYLVDSTVTVRFETSGGTATAGTDYVPRSETLTFAPGETEKTFNIQLINDEVIDPDETVTLALREPTGNAVLGTPRVATLSIEDDDPHRFHFSDPVYEVSEDVLSLVVTVYRTGAPTVPVSVGYSTSDGTASERSDYVTARGRLTFAPGESQKSFRLLIVDDVFVEGEETVNLTLLDPKGGVVTNGGVDSPAVVRITSEDADAPTSNPIDASEFFVRQHYFDFLNRLPDANGLPFWNNEIESCGFNAQCREVRRINVSAAFFLSIEFQTTGYLAYLTNKTAFGSRPLYAQFMYDVQTLQRGFVFGEDGAAARLEANKRAYFDEFVTRPAFVTKFGGMSNAEYVSALLNEAGLAPTVGNLFVSRLDAAQVVPQSGSGATGVVILRRDHTGNGPAANVSLALRNLTGPPTAVHIHGPAAPGANAPSIIALPSGEFADFRLDLTAEQINQLNNGQLYIDVHTESFPDGEIRARLGHTLFRGDVLTSALDNQILTRAQVLRAVAEFDELKAAEFNRAFVLMQYFGYLRRDPDEDGYNFWLGKLNEFNGDYIRAEMVKAFITSTEYRQRFGP
ncbi:MAG TPA: Calx-beta domain-containing protein [Pyrinomonadaceae bacterium]